MSTSEIAKLESRWRENRQGLTFAPLAEAYRKMGDPARALEVLGEGLAVNPNYIPASIVLGRCHLDLGDDRNAESAFVHVLSLDSENVIALRALADIAERGGRLADAQQRLQSLLAVDRGNDEARAQLAGLEARLAEGASVIGPEVGNQMPEATVATGDVPDADMPLASAAAVDWDDAPMVDASPDAEDTSRTDITGEVMANENVFESPVPADSEADAGLGWNDEEPEPAAAAVTAEDADADANASGIPAQDAADGMDWIPEPEPFMPEDVQVDPSIQLQEHLTPDAAVSPLEDLVVDDAPEISDAAVDSEAMTGLVGQDFQEHSAAVVPLEDLKTGVGALNDFDDLERVSELDLSAADSNEFQVSSAADELGARVQAEDDPDPWLTSVDAPADFPPLDTEEPADVPEAGAPSGFPTVANSFGSDSLDEDAAGEAWDEEDSADIGAPELVVTESMADLYLRQGHRKEALAVYRLLYQRTPDDLRLRERVDELETELAVPAPAVPQAAEVVSLAAPEEGRSVVALFRRMLGTPPAEPYRNWQEAVAPPARPLDHAEDERDAADGAPTRPAGDHLSLSDVFGDEGSPVPPAVRASHDAADDDVSFDAFFGDPSGEQARARTPSRDDDDLDQFQSWLQNLKR